MAYSHTISTVNRLPTALAYLRSVSTVGDTRPPSSRATADPRGAHPFRQRRLRQPRLGPDSRHNG